MSDSLPALLFTMEPFLYLDESMQHIIQDSRDGKVADIDFIHQVAQSSTQQGDCEPVLMDEDRPVPEDQDESDDDEKDEEEVSSVQCSLSLYTLRDLLVYHHRQWEWRQPLKLVHTRLGRRHTHANIVDGALLGVEILKFICGKYIPQLIKKLLISCLTKTNSAHIVLTIPIAVVI